MPPLVENVRECGVFGVGGTAEVEVAELGSDVSGLKGPGA